MFPRLRASPKQAKRVCPQIYFERPLRSDPLRVLSESLLILAIRSAALLTRLSPRPPIVARKLVCAPLSLPDICRGVLTGDSTSPVSAFIRRCPGSFGTMSARPTRFLVGAAGVPPPLGDDHVA